MIKWIAQQICGIVRQPHLVADLIANDDLFFSEVLFWECSLTAKHSAVNRASMGSSPIIPVWDSGQEERRQAANLNSPVQIWAIPLCRRSVTRLRVRLVNGYMWVRIPSAAFIAV